MSANQGILAFPKKKARTAGKAVSASAEILLPRLLFILSVIALLIFGLVMLYSASFVEAFTDETTGNDGAHYFRRQLISVGVGLVAMILATVISYRIWNSVASWIPWVVVTLLLILTLIYGNTQLGGKRWIDLFGFNLQPSEFAKIAILLVYATLVIKLHRGENRNKVFLLGALAILLPIALIMCQPDLGTIIIIVAGAILVVWFGELRLKALGIGIVFAAILTAGMILSGGFRAGRVDAWLDPWPLAANEGYQIINSFYAFAGGGVSGVGLGLSHQKYLYLPQPQNDLIFPIIGEELGLIGTVSVVLLFLLFLYSAFRIARNAPDFYGSIVAGSAAAMIGFQAFLNMFCMTNLLPLTGKPLPFFSAGGSSIVTTLILVGLVLSVSFRSARPDVASKRRDELLIIEGGKAISGKGWSAGKATENAAAKTAGKNAATAGKTATAAGKPTGKTQYRKPGLRTKKPERALTREASPAPESRSMNHSNPALQLSPARNSGYSASLNLARSSSTKSSQRGSSSTAFNTERSSPSLSAQRCSPTLSAQRRSPSPSYQRSPYQ